MSRKKPDYEREHNRKNIDSDKDGSTPLRAHLIDRMNLIRSISEPIENGNQFSKTQQNFNNVKNISYEEFENIPSIEKSTNEDN